LDEAAAALDKISQDDMTQLKSYVNPPVAAAIVMEGVCYVFNEDNKVPFQPKEPGSMEKIQDFWAYSKKNLLNAKLIARVKDFKEDKIKAIPDRNIQKLKAFALKPEFEKDKVFTASKAAGSLSLWIRAVVDTYGALLVVEPKKKQLAEAEEKLSSAEKILGEKKAALEEVLSLLRKLEDQYQTAKKKEEELKRNVERCIVQLDRAEKLIKGLGGEKIAWGKKVI
jgi:dynein heavy chain, axonemal